jgi:hypothetical protein
MKRGLGRLFVGGGLGGLLIGLGRRVRQRRRHLAMMPISISTAAGMTFRRCRREGTLRQRSRITASTPDRAFPLDQR